MSVRVAINGFGRIGRNVLRAIVESDRKDISVVAINDLAPIETNAHLLRYDSVHGRFPGEVTVYGDTIDCGNGRSASPRSKIPTSCHGRSSASTSRSSAPAFHLQGEGGGAPHGRRQRGARFRRRPTASISPSSTASTTTSSPRTTSSSPTPRAPPTAWRRWRRCCNDAVGIEKGFMTTIHSYTNDQPRSIRCTRICIGRAPRR